MASSSSIFDFDSSRKDDFDYVLERVKNYGNHLKNVSGRLKKNRQVVTQAVQHNFLPFEYAHKSLRFDPNFVLSLLKQGVSPRILKFVSEEIRDDKNIILAAIEVNANYALANASERLKDNYYIVFEAVTRDGASYIHASERLKDDRSIVLIAVRTCGNLLCDEAKKFSNNLEIVLTALKNKQFGDIKIGDELKDHPEIIKFLEEEKKKLDENDKFYVIQRSESSDNGDFFCDFY